MLAALLAGAAWAADVSGPAWSALTPAQQQALAPLQRDWVGIDPNRKQKWLEVAARFPRLPADERARVQQRMADWARLTPAERASARMQFQEVRQLPAEERQARWQQYRALSDEERKSLAQRAKPAQRPNGAEPAPRSPTAAPGTRTTAKRNLVETPATPPPRPRVVLPTIVQARPGATTTTMSTRVQPPPHHQTGLPKIAATPTYVDPATLLPRRGPQGAAVRAGASDDPAEQP